MRYHLVHYSLVAYQLQLSSGLGASMLQLTSIAYGCIAYVSIAYGCIRHTSGLGASMLQLTSIAYGCIAYGCIAYGCIRHTSVQWTRCYDAAAD